MSKCARSLPPPIVSMDYCFQSKHGIFDKAEWRPFDGEEFVKVSVLRDSRTKAVFCSPCAGERYR